MKKLLFAVPLLLPMLGTAAACEPAYSLTPQLLPMIERSGGWPLSQELCEALVKNRIAIDVDGRGVILANNAVGWASVGLMDLDSGVVVGERQNSTQITTGTEQSTVAGQMFYKAFSAALMNLDFNTAYKQLQVARAKKPRTGKNTQPTK